MGLISRFIYLIKTAVLGGKRNPAQLCEADTILLTESTGGEKPLRANLVRTDAEKLLQMFITHVKALNTDPRFIYRASRVAIFGSFYNSQRERIGDLDIAVELAGKLDNAQCQKAWDKHHIKKALRGGRRFKTKKHRRKWPQEECYRFLRNQEEDISLHEFWEIVGSGFEYKTIFEELDSSHNSVPHIDGA